MAANALADVDLLSEPPGAQMVVDNRPDRTCTAPCTLSLSNGRHTLSTQLPGYTPAQRIFNVPEDNSVFAALDKSTGTLVLTSIPAGSTIVIDGKNSGHTPATLHLTPGDHRLGLSPTGAGFTNHDSPGPNLVSMPSNFWPGAVMSGPT